MLAENNDIRAALENLEIAAVLAANGDTRQTVENMRHAARLLDDSAHAIKRTAADMLSVQRLGEMAMVDIFDPAAKRAADESGLYYHDIPEGRMRWGEQPRIYRSGRLVAEVGNAELTVEAMDRWEDDARALVDGANAALSVNRPNETGEK